MGVYNLTKRNICCRYICDRILEATNRFFLSYLSSLSLSLSPTIGNQKKKEGIASQLMAPKKRKGRAFF